jgi:hypothetical protein
MVRVCGRAFFFSLFLLLVASPFAFADDATAKLHFENGIHLYDQQPPDYEGALAEFRAAEKDKPSPGIKRNIALCLRALHRYGEAMDELEEMLATGGDKLKPQTREAGQKMIEELSALIATIRVKIVLHKSGDPKASPVIPRVDLTIDDEAIPPEKLANSLRVGPGEHLLIARAAGYGDASKKVSVVSGDKDVPVQLDLLPIATTAELGSLTVHASNPRASIFIDGVALASGNWEGGLPSGKHHIEARADGSAPFTQDVDVAPGAHVVVEANVGAGTGAVTGAITTPPPPPYNETGKPKVKEKPPERKWYLQGGVAGFFGTASVEPGPWNEGSSQPVDHGFDGLSLLVKFGRKLTRVLSIEAWAEVGASKPVAYNVPNSTQAADVTWGYGQLGPELRIHSLGNFQFFAGTGVGLEFDYVALNNLNSTSTNTTITKGPTKGTGLEGVWLIEAGAKWIVNERYFFEGSIFLDVSGDGNIKDTSSTQPYFANSPYTHGGLRFQFGFDL